MDTRRMRPGRRVPGVLFALALIFGPPAHAHKDAPTGQSPPVAAGQPIAPRLQNLGAHHHAITTASPEAQRFFDQGLTLAYGFNHREASRAFQEAARLDPDCAMCYWGQALVLGPNINAPMDPGLASGARALVEKARATSSGASPAERAYIDALSARYGKDTSPDRRALDEAYAQAMASVHAAFPEDLDAATLYAESLMDLRPWNYWTRDGKPYAETSTIVSVLESVLERNPAHPGATHLYIHVLEAHQPARAEKAADTLRGLVPGAGHLQHMPSHIYVRIGRYRDASAVNHAAIAADEDYIAQCRAQGIYPLTYYPHNIHFLWFASSWEGNGREALAAAREVQAKTTEHLDELPEWGQIFPVTPLYALARFGKWDEILEEARPPKDHVYWSGIWHYARGLAYTRKGEPAKADQELAALDDLVHKAEQRPAVIGGNDAAHLLTIARFTLSGELAAAKGQTEKAIGDLHRAVLLEDALNYIEPSDWYLPVRQALGAVLLTAHRPVEAESVYWADLKRNPDNGWSLFGLKQSLEAQGKMNEAEAVQKRFARAWSNADVTLTSSRF